MAEETIPLFIKPQRSSGPTIHPIVLWNTGLNTTEEQHGKIIRHHARHFQATFLHRKFRSIPFRRVYTGIILSLGVSLALLLLAGCTSTKKSAISVDRNNPESVLRAYFEAWNRNDWSLQASLMADMYAHMMPEPVESIRILKLQLLPDSSSSDRVYQVSFEIKVKGRGVSMSSGRYDWTYTLSWDANHGSWLITNYGAA